MNKKIFYFSIFLLFALFLFGCDSIIVDNTEIDVEVETRRVKDVVDGFWEAINDLDASMANSYCNGFVVWRQFTQPYFESVGILEQFCPNLTISLYWVINDISFRWDQLGHPRAIVNIQVNKTVMGCSDHDGTKVGFGTMELSYNGGADDVWWLIDGVWIDF